MSSLIASVACATNYKIQIKTTNRNYLFSVQSVVEKVRISPNRCSCTREQICFVFTKMPFLFCPPLQFIPVALKCRQGWRYVYVNTIGNVPNVSLASNANKRQTRTKCCSVINAIEVITSIALASKRYHRVRFAHFFFSSLAPISIYIYRVCPAPRPSICLDCLLAMLTVSHSQITHDIKVTAVPFF